MTMQAKFASFMPMRTPVIGDRANGYLVGSSGLIGNVRVFTLEPTYDESILTSYVDVMSYESILENFVTTLKGDVFAVVYKVMPCRH